MNLFIDQNETLICKLPN